MSKLKKNGKNKGDQTKGWFIAPDTSGRTTFTHQKIFWKHINKIIIQKLFREEMKTTPTWSNVFGAFALQEINYSYAAA